MTMRQIPTGGNWGGGAARLTACVQLHNDGRIVLPAECVDAAVLAAELATAAGAAHAAATALQRAIGHESRSGRDGELRRLAIVDAVATQGPSALDQLDELQAARLRLPDLRERSQILQSARVRADAAVRWSFARHADAIADDLLELITTTVDAARADAPALAGIGWSDPAAIASLDAKGQAAAGRLAELAPVADLARHAAFNLFLDVTGLSKQATRDSGVPAAAEAFGIDRFVFIGGPIAGPSSILSGKGEAADFRGTWTWAPIRSALEELVRLALAEPDVDEPAAG
jgi:hypothetical protein